MAELRRHQGGTLPLAGTAALVRRMASREREKGEGPSPTALRIWP